MFRATEKASIGIWKLENNNLADIGGVLKYVHTEIIVEHQLNPSRNARKYNVDVIGHWLFMVKNTAELLATPKMTMDKDFGPYCAYDVGRSTNPSTDEKLRAHGDWVGAQTQQDDPRIEVDVDMWWYSLGGFCPNLEFADKGTHDAPNAQCFRYKDDPSMVIAGGLCSHGEFAPTGKLGCVYTYSDPQTVTVDQLSGLLSVDGGGRR